MRLKKGHNTEEEILKKDREFGPFFLLPSVILVNKNLIRV